MTQGLARAHGPRELGSIEILLLSSLVRHASALTAARRHEMLRMVMAYLDQHLAEPVYLDDVARHVGFERSSLSRATSRIIGVTFTRLVQTHKVYAAAIEMYRSEAALRDVAACTGFADVTSFCRTFRNVTGVTPAAFRRLAESLMIRETYVHDLVRSL